MHPQSPAPSSPRSLQDALAKLRASRQDEKKFEAAAAAACKLSTEGEGLPVRMDVLLEQLQVGRWGGGKELGRARGGSGLGVRVLPAAGLQRCVRGVCHVQGRHVQ